MNHGQEPAHGHTGDGSAHGTDALAWTLLEAVAALSLAAAAAAYAVGLWRSRGRSPWPVRRALAWYAGLLCAAAGMLGPLAAAARTSFTGHMAAHLLVGMVAPLLLVLGRPLTLLLRALPPAAARAASRVLRGRPVRVLTHPVMAATLNAGGLWLLYTTDLYGLMHASAVLHGAVHLHFLLAGFLLNASLVGRDPDPHRAPLVTRALVLVVFIAAHSVLAKWLFAHPPAGVEAADGRAGAQLMYYGGDLVDVTVVVLMLAGWYTATAPRQGRASSVSSGQVRDVTEG